MSTQYTLKVHNNSSQTGSFCIFQESPDVNEIEIATLAWLAKEAHPTTKLLFDWTLDYSFIWSRTKSLEPGTKVFASQSWDANLKTQNKVEFDYNSNAYTFDDQAQGEQEGTLYINQSQRIKSGEVSLGIGMSGKGTFVVGSQPNMQVMMRPKPAYWIVFGNYTEGEILDIGTVTPNAYKLEYRGVTDLEIEFTAKNTWKEL